MKQDPVNEHAAGEQLPTETEQSYGILTAGILALIAIGTTIYLVS